MLLTSAFQRTRSSGYKKQSKQLVKKSGGIPKSGRQKQRLAKKKKTKYNVRGNNADVGRFHSDED